MARALGDGGALGGEHGAGHGQASADGRVQLTTGNRPGGNASGRDAGADGQAEIEVLLPGLANSLGSLLEAEEEKLRHLRTLYTISAQHVPDSSAENLASQWWP